MTRLFIIRHGQSLSNINNTFTGWINPALSELGMKQAEKTADYIYENYKIDKVYSSDLDRAFYTGKAVADRFGLDVTRDKGLREIFGGVWEGMKFEDIVAQYPDEYEVWRDDLANFKSIDGESIKQVYDRVSEAVKKIASANDGKNVVIASHAVAIRTLLCYAMGKGVDDISNIDYVSNASVTVMAYEDGKLRLEKVGYDEHLTGMKTALPKNI